MADRRFELCRTLPVRDTGAHDVDDIHEKVFLGFDVGIAINGDRERVGRLPLE
jgi:hypothetical protein